METRRNKKKLTPLEKMGLQGLLLFILILVCLAAFMHLYLESQKGTSDKKLYEEAMEQALPEEEYAARIAREEKVLLLKELLGEYSVAEE